VVTSYSIWLMSRFNLYADFSAIASPRVILGIGMAFFFVPLTTVSFAHISKEEMGNAAGIFNLVRNLGGSFGVAFATTVLSQRAQVHQNFLVEHITPYNPVYQRYFDQLSQWLKTQQPQLTDPGAAIAMMYRQVQQQASMLAFNDVFWVLALISAALIILTALFRGSGQVTSPPGVGH
jgi:MFS transporter, DHA2 family, multidrug resistance protein